MGKGRHGAGPAKKDADGYIPPPDGGWGWVVVLSSFLIHVIADGIVYSFGVFLPVFVNHFNSGRGQVSWVGSLQPAVTYTVGPLASALTNRYGCRVVTIVGALICAFGFCISVVAESLYFLYFSSGILAGLGFGLIYLPAIVSVAQYFEKRRSFATGLAVCGSGFGTFILAPVTELLLQAYGWRGSMLILGGLLLNVVVCGGVMRPLEGTPVELEVNEGSAGEEELPQAAPQPQPAGDAATGKSPSQSNGHVKDKFPSSPEAKALLSSGEAKEAQQKPKPKMVMLEVRDVTDLLPNGVPTYVKPGLHFHSHQHLAPAGSNGLATPPETEDPALLARSDGALHHRSKPVQQRRVHGYVRQSSTSSNPGTAARPVGRKDVFYTASLQHIPLFVANHDRYITSIISIAEEKEEVDGRGKVCGVSVPAEFAEAIHQMMDFSLLRNPVFLLFAISNFITAIGFNMPFMFLPDRAILSGIDEGRAAWLLSAIGISNTVGRVVFGFLADVKGVNRLMLYNSALVICGVATALSPVVGGNYSLLMTYAAVFGVFIGVYVSLTSIVLVDLLGIELLTNSFGLLLLFQGFATFIGPPLAGWMCDWTGSYDISFNVMGTLIAVSGAMLCLLPCVQRRFELKAPKVEIVHRQEMGAISSTLDITKTGEEELHLKSSL